MADQPRVPFAELLQNARAELTSQFGQEAKLLQAETKAKVSSLTTALALGVVGAFVALFSLGVALEALIFFIVSFGVSPALACFLVSITLAVLAAALVMAAKATLKSWTPIPLRTFAALKDDFVALRKAVSNVSS